MAIGGRGEGKFGPMNFNVRDQRSSYKLHFVFSRSFETCNPSPIKGMGGGGFVENITTGTNERNVTYIIIRDPGQWCFPKKCGRSYNCSSFRCKLLWPWTRRWKYIVFEIVAIFFLYFFFFLNLDSIFDRVDDLSKGLIVIEFVQVSFENVRKGSFSWKIVMRIVIGYLNYL